MIIRSCMLAMERWGHPLERSGQAGNQEPLGFFRQVSLKPIGFIRSLTAMALKISWDGVNKYAPVTHLN